MDDGYKSYKSWGDAGKTPPVLMYCIVTMNQISGSNNPEGCYSHNPNNPNIQ